MQKAKIPTIIGIIILTVGLAVGAVLIQSQKIFKLGADVTATPQNVRITNITDNSFSVSWTTQKEVMGFLLWGESETSLGNTESDELTQAGYLHQASVSGLTEQKTYYFKINSQETVYDNNGLAWEVKIPGKTAALDAKPISGTVLTSTGTPADHVLLYANIGGASPLSTITSSNGSYVFPISNLRTTDLTSSYSLNESSDVIELSVQAGPLGISSAQIYANSARPAPPLLLGQVHDFKNIPQNSEGSLPEADITAPEDHERASRFDVSESSQTVTSTNPRVTIISIDEGESVTTEKPQFFGKGPSGTQITIKVESANPATGTTTVGGSGNWSWTPPTNLSPGSHTVTISYKDQNGIVRNVTRHFFVQAAEGPAFQATPSATPRTTTTPQPTTSPKASITPTITPRSTATSTPVPQPISGTPLPTILMLLAGTGVFLTGIFISLKTSVE